MLKPFTLTFASMAMAASMYAAEPFTLSYDFDSETDFASGWNYESSGMVHNTAEHFNAPATDNPDNMVLGKQSANMQETVYTPVMMLAGGEPCTIEFDYWAPGGSPELLYHVGLNITATKEQSASGNSVSIGSVPTMKAYSEWTHFTFTFTPETDGEYCFGLKTANQYNMTSGCGSFCIDNVTISGTGEDISGGGSETPGPEPGPEPSEPTGKEAFELEFNFDNDTDYTDGTMMAPGWSFSGGIFQRAKGTDFGVAAHSGDYVLGKATVSFNETLFTPMVELVAGQPCTLEFYYMAPGGTPPTVRNVGLEIKAGTAQDASQHTVAAGTVTGAQYSEWTRQTFTFTPDVTGEYCFSIKPCNEYGFTGSCGGAYIDDVIISGYRPVYGGEQPVGPTVDDLEPNDDNIADCLELPYLENFSDAEHYDGQTYLPIGWHSTGTTVWVTANVDALPAADGQYYMIAYHSDYERDENAYTPFFNLEEGRTYTATFQTYIQGNDYNEDETLTTPKLRFTVGTEQDSEFHATLLTIDKRSSGWVEQKVSFTPRKSGAYSFAFMLSGPANSGIVAVDNLVITSEGLVARVEPAFSVVGVFDIFDSLFTVDDATPVRFINRSRYADSYEWHVEGAVPETSTDEHPAFIFPASGQYNVELTATNAKGSRSTSHSYTVKVVETGGYYALTPYNESDDKYFDRGAVPSFTTDADDYVTSFNHYYYTMAQRYELPASKELMLSQITCWISDRRYANMPGSESSQSTKPFSIVVYGAHDDGSIDTENIIGRKATTVGEALGSTGLGGIAASPQDIVFDQPMTVKGTIYVSFEYSDELLVDPLDVNLGRSYLSTTAMRHGHGRTTLYAKPYNVPADCDAAVGQWCSIDKLDSSMAGIGADWTLWVATEGNDAVALTPDGKVTFAVTATPAGDILVSGTSAGSSVDVYDARGLRLLSVPACDGSTLVPAARLGKGLFIVSCPEGSAKILK